MGRITKVDYDYDGFKILITITMLLKMDYDYDLGRIMITSMIVF